VPLPDFTTTPQFQPLPIRARELKLAVWVNLMHTIFCNRKKPDGEGFNIKPHSKRPYYKSLLDGPPR
jgi:hypothetical protein